VTKKSKPKRPSAIPAESAIGETLTKGWRKVRFGEVVRNVNETERNPLEAGMERFVGLEHIEPENLKLKRWGNLTDDDVTFTKRFRKGQVLFGKRRAYQRKVAVAEFDGICSGDILTFEPKGNDLLLELLPFIVQSEGFFEHALGTSSGSLSPRTRWSQLQDYEFPLPPKDEQRRIADILGSSVESTVAGSRVLQDLQVLKSALQLQMFQNGIRQDSTKTSTLGKIPSRWMERRLIEVTDRICVGLAMSVTEFYRDTGVPILRNQNIRPLWLDDADLLYLDPSFADSMQSKKVKAGDILTARTGANMGQTCLAPSKYGGAHTFTTLITTCNKVHLLPEFFVQHMNSIYGLREIERLATTGGKNNLNVTDFAEYRIAVPPLEEQRQIAEVFEEIDRTVAAAEGKVADSKVLTKSLMTSIFSVPKSRDDGNVF
jgi:type I restriction enzyme S subunit